MVQYTLSKQDFKDKISWIPWENFANRKRRGFYQFCCPTDNFAVPLTDLTTHPVLEKGLPPLHPQMTFLGSFYAAAETRSKEFPFLLMKIHQHIYLGSKFIENVHFLRMWHTSFKYQ